MLHGHLRIRVDRQADDYFDPPTDALRFINDCTKVDDDGRAHQSDHVHRR